MICISLSPPYGTLIALLLKQFETRGWQTSYRGQLGIHQTAAPGPRGTTEAVLWDRCLSDPFGAPLLGAGYGNPARLPRGKIVAVVDLAECFPTALRNGRACYGYVTAADGHGHAPYTDIVEVSAQEQAFGDYSAGRFAWQLANVRALPEPVPARGMPGLWRCDAATTAEIARQLGKAVPA